MKVFWCPQTRAMRVLWMLEELGVDYDRVKTDVMAESDPHRAELLTASPMGKVPALIDGEVRMSESAAICLYLADKYAPGALAPKVDAPERGAFLYWIMYTPAVVEPCMSEKFRKLEPNKYSNGWGDYDSMIQTLEDTLGGKNWLVGDKFSAADVMVGSSCYFMKRFGLLADSEVLDGYIARCISREGFKRAEAIDAAG